MVSCSSGHVAEEDIELGPFLYVPPQGGEYTLASLGLISLHCWGSMQCTTLSQLSYVPSLRSSFYTVSEASVPTPHDFWSL